MPPRMLCASCVVKLISNCSLDEYEEVFHGFGMRLHARNRPLFRITVASVAESR